MLENAVHPTCAKVDLHVHSEFSDKLRSVFVSSVKAAECFTKVEQVYAGAVRRGMNLVTITDHDDIRGSLELMELGHSNTFIAEEVSARFPEDGCIVHTIALHITEAQHTELQRLRRNVYDLVSYMQQEQITHFLAHPLSQVNGRMTSSHVQRCLLMFTHLEVMNGVRDEAHARCLRAMLDQLTPELLERWAHEHPQTPVVVREPNYGLVGGSDDHGDLCIARAYTEFDGPATGDGLVAAMKERRTRPAGSTSKSEVLGHIAYSVTLGNLRKTGQFDRMLAQLDGRKERAVPADAEEPQERPEPQETKKSPRSPLRVGSGLVDAFAKQLAEAAQDGHTDEGQQRLLEMIRAATLHLRGKAWKSFFDGLFNADILATSKGIAPVLQLGILGLPYLLGTRYHVLDRDGAYRFTNELGFEHGCNERPRVLVATDTVDRIDGLGLGLRRLATAADHAGHDLRIMAPATGRSKTGVDDGGIVRIPSVYAHRFKMYPEYEFGVPELNTVLHYIANNEINLVQCSTPGPMGVAAFAAARILRIPVVGQFHTDVPEYVTRLTGDPIAGAMSAWFVGKFYSAMDRVLVPSDATAKRVCELGVPRELIARVPRGIDLDLFHPGRRASGAYERFGINGELKVVYVGRISKEKSLDRLLGVFDKLELQDERARLVVIGDGPQRTELMKRYGNSVSAGRVVFTGIQTGEELAKLYASADLFVSPSETETFGNTVAEAQAAGVPVIVSDRGATRELVRDGVTGLVVNARNQDELRYSIEQLLLDPQRRSSMSGAAVNHMRQFQMSSAVPGVFQAYSEAVQKSAPQGDAEHH